MGRALKTAYNFFRSTLTALILIAYLTVYLIIASIFAETIVFEGAIGVLLFYFPLTLFFFNLLVCTVSRIGATIRDDGYRGKTGILKIGPDLVHLSLLLLILAGVISLEGRVEGVVELAPGDTVRLSSEITITLSDFTTLRYENGNPKAWISTVDIRREGKLVKKGAEIRVNKPLKVGGAKIYQSSYRKGAGETHTVLRAVYDPAGPLIIAALTVMVLGIFLVFGNKIREL